MMRCPACGCNKEDGEFWSATYLRHVAKCLACRRIDKPDYHQPRVTPVGFRLITDPTVAPAIAFVLNQLSQNR